MKIFVVNAGSSSLKYQLIDMDNEQVLAKGLCERIGIDGRLVYQKAGLDKEITECAMPTHKEAIQFVLDALTNEKTGAIKSLKEVDAIGHRVVHGGEKFAASAVITDEMIAERDKSIEEAKTSPILGFSFNTDSVKTELSNISNVMNQYLDGLNTGTVDPDETLPKLKDALNRAGYDKVLTEMQKQYDAFRKESK